MAILQMKKIKCAVVKSEKKAFLKELTRLGCVQIEALQEGREEFSLTAESSDYIELKNEHAKLLSAVDILKSVSPEKGGLLSSKPELERETLLDDSGTEEAAQHGFDVVLADERIKQIRAQESRIRADIEAMKPWLSLNMPLSLASTQRTSVCIGSFPIRLDLEQTKSELASISEEAEIFTVSEDKSCTYAAVISIKEDYSKVLEFIKEKGFNILNYSDVQKSAAAATTENEELLAQLATEKEQKTQFIADSVKYRDDIKLAADKYQIRMDMEEASEKLLSSKETLFFEGWIPAECVAQLDKALEPFSAAYDLSDPDEEEYPTVPVKLKNNKFTNSLNMVTNMYSLPQYGTVDPNPWMAPFFILFYGLMMADMGYGIIMIVAGIVALKKIKPRGNSLAFCQLLLYAGIATFICGALTGGFFSDVIAQFVTMATGKEWSMPYLFSPVNDSEMVLYGSLVLGAIHLNVGMICSFIEKIKAGEIKSAIWEEGSLWVLLIGAILAVLGIGNISGIPVLLIIGIAMLLFGAGREAKGFGKVTAAFGCIYNTATGWFGDVLSYSRIMALMLAGGVVGQVFNTVAIMPMKNSGVNAVSIIAFIIIFLLGHAMNFGLNLLGCYVHDLRLQCLEYFGKFYTDGGKPFTPLDIKGKFINPKNN